MKIKTNHDNLNLYCHYSKEPIRCGELYVEIQEECRGHFYARTYKIESYEMIQDYDDSNDIFISDQDDLEDLEDF